jgi:hypothetical protein
MREIKGLVIETQKTINNLQLQMDSFVKSFKSCPKMYPVDDILTVQSEYGETSAATENLEEINLASNMNYSDTDESTEFEVIQSTKGICIILQDERILFP